MTESRSVVTWGLRNEEGGITEEYEGIWGVTKMFAYLDCGDGLTGIYICQTDQIVHFKYVCFVVTPQQNRLQNRMRHHFLLTG